MTQFADTPAYYGGPDDVIMSRLGDLGFFVMKQCQCIDAGIALQRLFKDHYDVPRFQQNAIYREEIGSVIRCAKCQTPYSFKTSETVSTS